MIIRCDGISGVSPRSMSKLPVLLQPIATGIPTREPYSVDDRAHCTNHVACGNDRPPPLRKALHGAFSGSRTRRSLADPLLMSEG
jgi:hypothetical protein